MIKNNNELKNERKKRMKKIVIESENGSVGHVEISDTDRVYIDGNEPEKPLGNPATNRAIGGEDNTFDQVVAEIALLLAAHARDFEEKVVFQLVSVEPTFRFVYTRISPNGQQQTYRAKWSNGANGISIDLHGQSEIQNASQGNAEPPLGMNS